MSRTYKDRPYDLGKMENNRAVSCRERCQRPALFGKEADESLIQNFKNQGNDICLDNIQINWRGLRHSVDWVMERQKKSARAQNRDMCLDMVKAFNGRTLEDSDDFIREDHAKDHVWYY